MNSQIRQNWSVSEINWDLITHHSSSIISLRCLILASPPDGSRPLPAALYLLSKVQTWYFFFHCYIPHLIEGECRILKGPLHFEGWKTQHSKWVNSLQRCSCVHTFSRNVLLPVAPWHLFPLPFFSSILCFFPPYLRSDWFSILS